mgnify:CR=1 FL=1
MESAADQDEKEQEAALPGTGGARGEGNFFQRNLQKLVALSFWVVVIGGGLLYIRVNGLTLMDGLAEVVSLLRRLIPKQVRIATYIIIIATFVTIVDYAIQAISLDLYNALGAFIQLIVVNCMILGRAEAYASKQPLGATIINGLGIGAGFTFALLCLGVVREVLGAGSLFGIPLFGEAFQPWVVMVLPPGGFFVLGAWLLIFEWFRQQRESRQRVAEMEAVKDVG